MGRLKTMKTEDYIWKIHRKILINAKISKIWDIISSDGHLEKFHPFCKKNEVKVWDNSSHEDSIEYYNGRILYRNFYNWFEGKGFDLTIGDSKGKESHVFWRLSKADVNTLVSITVKPYIYNKGSKLKNFVPYFTFVRPKLANYLYSVLMGLKHHSETDQKVVRDQFGRHSWFS